MKFWEIFWLIVVSFSVVSFTYLSLKILIKGWPELKFMFNALSDKSLTEQNAKDKPTEINNDRISR